MDIVTAFIVFFCVIGLLTLLSTVIAQFAGGPDADEDGQAGQERVR